MTYDFGVSVEFPQEAVEWAITWHTFLDACPKCQNLNGYPFHGVGDLPQSLMHPQWGAVWDIANNESLTHQNCRCDIDVMFHIYPSKIPIILGIQQVLQMPEFDVEEVSSVGKLDEMQSALQAFKKEVSEMSMGYHELREVEILVQRTLRILEETTGSKEIKQAINNIQRLITIVRMAQMSLHALQIAQGPLGWAVAISGIAMTGVYVSASYEVNAH